MTDKEYQKLESVRPEPVSGEPPPAPLYYDERYELPVHRTKMLQKLYHYKRDKHIEFYGGPHVYLVAVGDVDGEATRRLPAGASVSGLLKKV